MIIQAHDIFASYLENGHLYPELQEQLNELRAYFFESEINDVLVAAFDFAVRTISEIKVEQLNDFTAGDEAPSFFEYLEFVLHSAGFDLDFAVDKESKLIKWQCKDIGESSYKHETYQKALKDFFQYLCKSLKDVKLSNKPKAKMVCLCGSTRFKSDFEKINHQLTLAGEIVTMPGCFMHADGIPITNEQKQALDELHKRKIDIADYVYVINPGGYIGESTRSEIDYAIDNFIPVKYLVIPQG